MNNLAVKEQQEVARPLKVLVPLIKEEIEAGNAAGMSHYRRAGEMLIEAKSQLAHGEWKAWLDRNFEFNARTARTWMAFAAKTQTQNGSSRPFSSMDQTVRPQRADQPIWQAPVREILAERVDVGRLAQEQQNKEKELRLVRDLAGQLIDIGYKVLATKLHPDKGGSQEAMSRLNEVRRRLRQAI